MTTLLDDWLACRAGRAELDHSHFLGLFKEHGSAAELQQIFAGFLHAQALQARAQQVLAAGSLDSSLYLLPVRCNDEARLEAAALAWWQEQARYCLATQGPWPERADWQPAVERVSREQAFKALHGDTPNAWVFEHFADTVIDGARHAEQPLYALLEALYGIAADYYLAWYIAAPLLALEVDFSRYFELWRLGGMSVVLQDRLLVAG